MTIQSILNGKVLYLAVITALIFILGVCVKFLKMSWDRALELGYDKSTLKSVVKSSSLFSIVPSIAIVIGLFSLASVLGVPWSWFRLSVVGSLSYELMAAEMSVAASGYESLRAFLGSGDVSLVSTIMMVMSVSMLGSIVTNMIFGKKIQSSMISFQSKNEEWGSLVLSYFTLALAVVFLPVQLFSSSVHFATMVTSAIIAGIHLIIINKYKVKWLGEFLLANTMILGMISSVFWDKLLM